MGTEGGSKVLEYEEFLNERLRQDLRLILDQRDKLYEEISEYMQLKSTILKIKEDIKPESVLKTKVDLGCNFYVQANVTASLDSERLTFTKEGKLLKLQGLNSISRVKSSGDKKPNPSSVCIAIGFGFFLEMTLDEAVDFIKKKTDVLQGKIEVLTAEAGKVKANIRLVLEGLRELQQIQAETKPHFRDVLS